jgi:preprotein translocase subunit SecF
MLNIIGKKNLYFLISLLVIIPGTISLLLYGLKLSIDFTGGSRATFIYPVTVNNRTVNTVKTIFNKNKAEIMSVVVGDKQLVVQTKPITEKQDSLIVADLKKADKAAKQEEFETIGPTIGAETTLNAFKTIFFASILIVIYIAYSFRKVPKPASSWRFGVCAIIALIHDVLVVVGIFSILGHFFQVEVDSLFVTAILTVIGFSVHDTIVVFDRIRENLRKSIGLPFPQIVNDSVLQTLVRSLNTSLTAILMLLTLLLFGGESIRWFVVALLIGIISGTYSSIFNASPFLVLWQELQDKRRGKK